MIIKFSDLTPRKQISLILGRVAGVFIFTAGFFLFESVPGKLIWAAFWLLFVSFILWNRES